MSNDSSCGDRVPAMFKIDYTCDSEGRFRILELGHPFSSNHGGLEDNLRLLVQRLGLYYKHVYASGDIATGAAVVEGVGEGVSAFRGIWPIDELDLIPEPENSVVILRMLESPTHFTPFVVREQLRARGIPLAVFNAEPLACLCAYEKIIMQRLQQMHRCPMTVPTALVDRSSSRESAREQLERQGIDVASSEYFIVKPAFASCTVGVEVVERSQLLKYLKRHEAVPSGAFQRGANDLLSMLSITTAPPNSRNASTVTPRRPDEQAKLYMDFASQHGMSFLLDSAATDRPDTRAENPVVLVQPLAASQTVEFGSGERFYPTYRAFVTVEPLKDREDVQVVPLKAIAIFPARPHGGSDKRRLTKEHVVAGLASSSGTSLVFPAHLNALRYALNQGATRSFFRSMMFEDVNKALKQLVRDAADQNFQQYIQALGQYPPYQVLLRLPRDESAIAHYQNLVTLLHVFAYRFRAIRCTETAYSRLALDAVAAYEAIRAQDTHRTMGYVPFFVTMLTDTLQQPYYQPHAASPVEQKHDTLQLLLGMLSLVTDALKLAELRDESDVQIAEAVVRHFMHVFGDMFAVSIHSDLPPLALFIPRHHKRCLKFLIGFVIRLKQMQHVFESKQLHNTRAVVVGSRLVQWLLFYLRCCIRCEVLLDVEEVA